jgi:hypothetical protein
MPALNVSMFVDFFADESQFARATGPASVQIFPSAEIESTIWINPEPHRVSIQRGAKKLRINVRVAYQAEDGQRFEHRAEVFYAEGLPVQPFSHLPGRFVINKSETSLVDSILS